MSYKLEQVIWLVYENYLTIWIILTKCDKLLSIPRVKTIEQREETAKACEEFTKVFPLLFYRRMTRKMHVLSIVLAKQIRENGNFYKFLKVKGVQII